MDYPVKKLEYDGTVLLRDYTVKECINKKENMKVTLSGDVMTLTPEQLSISYVTRPSRVYESKFDKGLSYKLIGYNWEPDQIEL
jgi:hypothetical protein